MLRITLLTTLLVLILPTTLAQNHGAAGGIAGHREAQRMHRKRAASVSASASSHIASGSARYTTTTTVTEDMTTTVTYWTTTTVAAGGNGGRVTPTLSASASASASGKVSSSSHPASSSSSSGTGSAASSKASSSPGPSSAASSGSRSVAGSSSARSASAVGSSSVPSSAASGTSRAPSAVSSASASGRVTPTWTSSSAATSSRASSAVSSSHISSSLASSSHASSSSASSSRASSSLPSSSHASASMVSSTKPSSVTSIARSSSVLSSSHSSSLASSSHSSSLASSSRASSSASTSTRSSSATTHLASTTVLSTSASTTARSTSASSSSHTTTHASSASTTQTSSSAAPTSTGLSTRTLPAQVNAAYYPDWSYWSFPPTSIDFSKVDILDYAFGLPQADFSIVLASDNTGGILSAMVSAAHAAGKLARLSLGGWTGSVYFSSAVSTAANRQTFANNIAALYNQYNLDGIDIDWEYPGVQGAGSNGVSGSDSANFALFLAVLRQTLPPAALISATGQVWPFADANGNPLSDVGSFAAVLDWVLIMNYDIWGSSSTPGPNAPLNDGCNDSLQPQANAYAALSAWTSAGMPASQLMLGVPAYGYLQLSSATALTDKRKRQGYVTLVNDNGGTTNGQLQFNAMVSQGALTLDSTNHYVGAGGFTREWDACSSTPWLKSQSSGQIVTYDDPTSLSIKAQFARKGGMRGCNMWDISGDTSDFALNAAIRSGLGI